MIQVCLNPFSPMLIPASQLMSLPVLAFSILVIYTALKAPCADYAIKQYRCSLKRLGIYSIIQLIKNGKDFSSVSFDTNFLNYFFLLLFLLITSWNLGLGLVWGFLFFLMCVCVGVCLFGFISLFLI